MKKSKKGNGKIVVSAPAFKKQVHQELGRFAADADYVLDHTIRLFADRKILDDLVTARNTARELKLAYPRNTVFAVNTKLAQKALDDYVRQVVPAPLLERINHARGFAYASLTAFNEAA